MSAIECLAYISRARIGLRELTMLARWSREHNEELGMTGLLLYDGSCFFGYLEGEAGALQRLYDAIAADPRHEDVRQLERHVPDRRRLERWFMGYLYEPQFEGELESLWSGRQPLGDLGARLSRWMLEGDVL